MCKDRGHSPEVPGVSTYGLGVRAGREPESCKVESGKVDRGAGLGGRPSVLNINAVFAGNRTSNLASFQKVGGIKAPQRDE